jgi:hypothetical protein
MMVESSTHNMSITPPASSSSAQQRNASTLATEATPPAPIGFRWRTRLGVATTVLLLYGVLNVVFAALTPIVQHANGIMGAQIMNNRVDSRVLGKDVTALATTDRPLNDYMVAFMDTMCMLMMAFGLLQVAIVWFALRRRQMWALWALVLADLSFIPYLIAWTSTFSKYGATWGESLASFGGYWVLVVLGVALSAVLGWSDLREK